MVALHAAGEHTSAEPAELFGVARSTVYRAVECAARGSNESPADPVLKVVGATAPRHVMSRRARLLGYAALVTAARSSST
jgi:hypothetical protein